MNIFSLFIMISFFSQNNATNSTKPSQKKISMYFMKVPLENSTVETSNTNDGVHRKRKLSEDTDLLQVKLTKYDNVSNVYNVMQDTQQIHSRSNEANVIHDVLSNSSRNNSKKENITNDYEHINTICKLSEKQIMTSNTLQENKSDNLVNLKKSVPSNIKHDGIYSELESFFADDFKSCFEEEWCTDFSQINFKSLQRCKVIDVQMEYNSIVLTVKQEDNETCDATVRCSDFW